MPRSKAASNPQVPAGRLILVVGPDPTALAVLLDAARRRFHSNPAVAFPVLVSTRRGLFGGSEIVLSRREFAALADTGGFLATWQTQGALAGLPAQARALLDAGAAVVIGVPHEHVFDHLRPAAPRPAIRIVRVTAHTDLARARLNPKACLGRMLGPRQSRIARTRIGSEACDARVHVGASIGAAVGSISDAIAGVLATPLPTRRPGAASCKLAL